MPNVYVKSASLEFSVSFTNNLKSLYEQEQGPYNKSASERTALAAKFVGSNLSV